MIKRFRVRWTLIVLGLIWSLAVGTHSGVAQTGSSAPLDGISASTSVAENTTAQKAPHLDDFDAYIQKVLADWKVPGAAIVIVKDGKVVLSEGYGLRDVENNLPVTEQTLFPIASITKSFTVATLGTLGQRRQARLG